MTAFLGFCPPCPPPPENLKHVHYGRVFWLRVTSFTFPHAHPTSTTQKTRSEMAGFWVIASSPPISPSTRKLKTRPFRTCFLGSGEFVYLPSYILHLYNPKNPVQMAGFMVFCLITPHIPFLTRKLKTRPLRTCYLASGGFVYIPP